MKDAGAQEGLYIGIDIGGTGIKGGLVTAEGELSDVRSVRTPVEEGRAGIMREIEHLISELIAGTERQVIAIGVGSAGSIDPHTGQVIFATDNLPGWTGHPLAAALSERFSLPVRADNDVNVAALGEAWLGAASDYNCFALVALGTGVGGALVNEKRIIHGFNGKAGEIGHMILKQDGFPCNCGQSGCFEQYASGTALNRIAAEVDPAWTSYTLLQRYEQRDERAVAVMNRFVSDLAAGLVSVYHVFGPEAIIIGGGLGSSADIWWEELRLKLRELSPKPILVDRAKLGNQAGMIGAAYLAISK